MKRCLHLCPLLLLLQIAAAHNHKEVVKGPSVAGKAERWVPFGEPYQERVVSMLPGSNAPLAFDPYYSPPPPPPQFSPQQYFQPPQPPPAAYAAGTPMILPVIANQEKQEQNSKDLDVGLYTGMDIPWTHIPPFSTTYKAGMGAQTPPPLMPQAPFPSYYAGAAAPPPQPPFYPASPMRPFYPEERGINPWNSRVAPYPYYMRQQGGFSFNRAEDDEVKLVMHVPKEGAPGGVLVMEMKANVYRPVY